MPNLSARIKDIVEGDSLAIRRTIDRTASGLATGVTISNGWMTVKKDQDDADPGLFQKAITTTDTPGVGQIENDGTGDVDPVVRFDLVAADTRLIAGDERHYDIQVKTNGAAIYTGEVGRISVVEEITLAS